ncbi:DUF6950 family protein [Pseudoalteromonas rubra]|uniref:DUF6950 family protein n=1 Tax=Pseudoalteromonas rubra TaxID=43658 RepID=UPI002DB8DB05|nr:hypothetical protein [Pseudoalteromonas rubra]MEC4091850.1 hypothetical protein [Pseudoalteromonas rubra]
MTNTYLDLQEYLDLCATREFTWGEFDCCLFVANWILRRTGVDLARDFKGHYKTELGAKRRLKALGFKDIESVFKARLNPVLTSYARRGDLALVNYDGQLVGGIVGLNCVHCVTQNGTTALDLSMVHSCYSLESANV